MADAGTDGRAVSESESTINEHIKNIYADGELAEATTLRKFGNSEFSTKPVNFYNLDMVISVYLARFGAKNGLVYITKSWLCSLRGALAAGSAFIAFFFGLLGLLAN